MAYESADLLRLVQVEHTDEVAALEDGITTAGVGSADRSLKRLIEATLTAWTRAFGGPNRPATAGDLLRRLLAAARAAVRRILGALGPRATAALTGAVEDAVTLGAQQGAAFMAAATGRRLRVPAIPQPSRNLRAEAARLANMVTERRDRALHMLASGNVSRWSHVLAGLGAARAAVSLSRGHIAWVTAAAVAEGLDAVARSAGTLRLWVAEADACVRCLAYSGLIVQQDESFPGGLSWDPRQRRLRAAGVPGPPLHQHCRCRTVPWSNRWPAVGIAFPEALRREAERSIGYGRARPSESTTVRIRAARELLRTVDDLLPAVQTVARTAVRNGRFPAAA
ncbi:hypothetical protein [Streptomyces chartreusis]|uniref:hypothetical protein n=1 Tax=Streptomyces chartreusis TaxID=1969 RepID=UPI00123D3450|nr:hypothetical protein [Streptomyces chartreusis]QEV66222.1 hypothetical protein CP983_05790 [Streptomyces chartreusis]GGW98750.1 hypothetical protein GCM10010321_11460 [Streptomyces chartreusis]